MRELGWSVSDVGWSLFVVFAFATGSWMMFAGIFPLCAGRGRLAGVAGHDGEPGAGGCAGGSEASMPVVPLGCSRRVWQPAAMEFEATDLERIFGDCFFERTHTILVGGGEEPLYLPSSEPAHQPHRIVYREDYLASALHEVAHWCLAGAKRRRLEDYGYWYAPDGRDTDTQAAFERVEARPQALEWIFSDACGFEFNLSADNLDAGVGPSAGFAEAVAREKRRFLTQGLPSRAECYRVALESAPGSVLSVASSRPREGIATGSSGSIRAAAPPAPRRVAAANRPRA
jgi:elongation factor P hydroxylase